MQYQHPDFQCVGNRVLSESNLPNVSWDSYHEHGWQHSIPTSSPLDLISLLSEAGQELGIW